MITVGKGIAPLDLFSAFVKILAEAMTLLLFTQIGIPFSSPQGLWGQWCGWVFLGAADGQSKDACKNHRSMGHNSFCIGIHDHPFCLCYFHHNVMDNTIGAIAMVY
jgi:phosphate/sulfate permease